MTQKTGTITAVVRSIVATIDRGARVWIGGHGSEQNVMHVNFGWNHAGARELVYRLLQIGEDQLNISADIHGHVWIRLPVQATSTRGKI